MQQYNQMEQQYENLRDWSQFYGILRRKEDLSLTSYCIGCIPYTTTTDFYNSLTTLSNLWQKYCYLISKDNSFLKGILEPLRKDDDWVHLLLCAYEAEGGRSKDSLTYLRTDFFLDSRDGLPKLIEYNLIAVGMSYASKQLKLCQQICDPTGLYFPNDNIDLLVEATIQVYQQRSLEGLFVILIGDLETTFIEQKYVESQLISRGIRCKRVLFAELARKGRLDEKKDYYVDNELVSFAYFRTGFNLGMYDDLQEAHRCREQLAASNVISIPSISMELVNLKRTQTEMSKPEVMRKFLSQFQTQCLLKSLVPSWQFDSLSQEQTQAIMEMYRRNPGGYVLKPNMEGGYNNLFGGQGVEKLFELTPEERKHYILQEIIPPVYSHNDIMEEFNGKVVTKTVNYQIGKYGVICELKGQLHRNLTHGYLLRTHEKGLSEETVAGGTAGIVAWKHW